MSELISQLGIDWRLLLAQVFNFILLLIVLERFVYRPVIKVIDERKTQIIENNKQEERLNKKLAEIDSIQKNILKEAHKEGEKLRGEIVAHAEEARAHILKEAEKSAETLIESERIKFSNEVKRIQETLQSEVGTLITQVVEKTLKDALDKPTQEKVLARSVEEFKSEYNNKNFRGVIELKPRENTHS